MQTPQAGARPVVEEVPVKTAGIYVSLVVNRRHKSARIVDFLSGNFGQKAAAIDTFARREGIERVYTLVEREESLGWARVGFAREGSIPGYYKRSDAHLMGRVITTPPTLDEDGLPATPPPDANAAEKLLNAAKRLVAEVNEVPRGFKAEALNDAEVLASGMLPAKSRRGGAWFDERFGRTGERLHIAGRMTRAGAKLPDQVVSVELQEPFGNAFVQLTSWAQKTDDARMIYSSLQSLVEQLRAKDIGCTFALSPADNAITAAAFLAAGFKRTGLLAQHLCLGDRRVDALLWTRRGASSADADAA